MDDDKYVMKIIVGVFLFLLTVLNGLGIWILSDVKSDIKQNRAEFYDKMDRVVKFYKEEQTITMNSIQKLCDSVAKLSETVVRHETLLHLDHPTRKEFFKDRGVEKK